MVALISLPFPLIYGFYMEIGAKTRKRAIT